MMAAATVVGVGKIAATVVATVIGASASANAKTGASATVTVVAIGATAATTAEAIKTNRRGFLDLFDRRLEG